MDIVIDDLKDILINESKLKQDHVDTLNIEYDINDEKIKKLESEIAKIEKKNETNQ